MTASAANTPAPGTLLHGSTSRSQQPPPHLNSCDADGVRASKLQHQVQDPDSDGRPCESAPSLACSVARRRSLACSAQWRPRPGCACCSPRLSATRSGPSRPCTRDDGRAGWVRSQPSRSVPPWSAVRLRRHNCRLTAAYWSQAACALASSSSGASLGPKLAEKIQLMGKIDEIGGKLRIGLEIPGQSRRILL
jgi:hypothetical protein